MRRRLEESASRWLCRHRTGSLLRSLGSWSQQEPAALLAELLGGNVLAGKPKLGIFVPPRELEAPQQCLCGWRWCGVASACHRGCFLVKAELRGERPKVEAPLVVPEVRETSAGAGRRRFLPSSGEVLRWAEETGEGSRWGRRLPSPRLLRC